MPAHTTRPACSLAAGLLGTFVALLAVPAGARDAPLHTHTPASAITLLRTVRVGQNPVAVAVDEPLRRVFVLNQGPIDSNLVPTGPGSLSVLDASTGTLLRTISLGRGGPGAVYTLAVAQRAGRVIIGGVAYTTNNADPSSPFETAQVSTLNAHTGALLRTVRVGNSGYANQPFLAVDERTARIFATGSNSQDGSVLDAATGAALAEVGAHGPLAIDEEAGRVYVGLSTVLDAHTGEDTLTFLPLPASYANVGEDVMCMAADPRLKRLVIDLTHHYSNFASDVLIYDETRLQLVQTLTIAAGADCTMAVDAAHQRVILVNTSDSGWVSSNGGGSGTITVFDPASGAIVRSVTLPETGYLQAALAVDSHLARAIVAVQSLWSNGTATIRGNVHVFDTHSGRLLGSITTGKGPQSVAVDDRTGRVFVANQTDGAVQVLALAGGH